MVWAAFAAAASKEGAERPHFFFKNLLSHPSLDAGSGHDVQRANGHQLADLYFAYSMFLVVTIPAHAVYALAD